MLMAKSKWTKDVVKIYPGGGRPARNLAKDGFIVWLSLKKTLQILRARHIRLHESRNQIASFRYF
jgi:hypothetical protein